MIKYHSESGFYAMGQPLCTLTSDTEPFTKFFLVVVISVMPHLRDMLHNGQLFRNALF